MRAFVRGHRVAVVIIVTVIPALFTTGPTLSVGAREWLIAGWAYGTVVIAVSLGYLGWCWWRER